MQNEATVCSVISMVMAPHYATKNYSFMSCIVKVRVGSSWQKTVRKVLNKCHGVYNFRMDDNGLVEISGTVDPELLLKILGKAGRKAELRWFQFGECSSNLFLPFGDGYPRDGRFLHADSLPRPRPPSYQQIMSSSFDANDGYEYSYRSGPDGDDIGCCRVM